MKGLYLSNLNHQVAAGYDSKIRGQIQGMMTHNIDFELISFSEAGEIILRRFGKKKDATKNPVLLHSPTSSFLKRKFHLFSTALKHLRSNQIDLLYLRYPRSDPFYIIFLHNVKKHYPRIRIFCEFPTFPYDEELTKIGSFKSLLIRSIDISTRIFLKYFIDRAVVVNYTGSVFGMESINLSNGISVSSFSEKKYKESTLQIKLNLIGVANVQAWHGYDRVIVGMGKYYKRENRRKSVFLHIVGARDPMLSELKQLAVQQGVENHLAFYPPTCDHTLEELFEMSDVGISTLGAHRIGLHKLSPLKTREYCARAIPFILGYDDPDFPSEFRYALNQSPDDTPIDIDSVLNFAETLYVDSELHQKMREYARETLDWAEKMSDVSKEITKLLTSASCQLFIAVFISCL